MVSRCVFPYGKEARLISICIKLEKNSNDKMAIWEQEFGFEVKLAKLENIISP